LPGTTVVRVATDGSISTIAANVFPLGTVLRAGFGPDGALWIPTASGGVCQPELQRVTPAGASALFVIPVPCDAFNGSLPHVGSLASGDGLLWYTRDKYVGKIQL
jgi:hypothetical protein